MRRNVRQMKKAELLECLEVALDYFGMEDIEGPDHLLEELEERAVIDNSVFNKAIEGVERKLSQLMPSQAKTRLKEERHSYIFSKATARIKEAEQGGHKVSWTKVRKEADEAWVRLEEMNGKKAKPLSDRTLANIKRGR